MPSKTSISYSPRGTPPPPPPPPERTRRVTKATGKDKVQRVPAATAESTTTGLPPSAASTIPPGLLEQIVSKVTTEVTKQLTPLLIPAGQSAHPRSQLQEEVPACTLADVTTPSSLSVVAVVSDSVNAVNATLSGEVLPATTSPLYHQALYLTLPASQLIRGFLLNLKERFGCENILILAHYWLIQC